MTIDLSSCFVSLRRFSQPAWMCLVALAPLLATGCSGSQGGGAAAPPDLGSEARLASLTISGATITFSPDVIVYDVAVKFLTQASSITPIAVNAAASIEVNGSPAASGTPTLVPLQEGGNTVLVTVTSEDGSAARVYTLLVDREFAADFAQDAYVKASNTEAEDEFGVSLAVDGDTLAVGASREDSDATGVGGDEGSGSANLSGAVYVFTRSAGVWSQQAYIKASNTDAIDRFGMSLALDGDTLAVGASGESSSATGVGGDENDNSANSSGAVYVFTRTAGIWTSQAYVKASNPSSSDRFGLSVALDGDTLAVAAVEEGSDATGVGGDQNNDLSPNSGAVYVFARNAGDWTQQAYVKASNSQSDDRFGRAVAIDGDTLVVGANREGSSATGVDGDESDNSASGSGAVYVFTRVAGAWSQQAYVKASNSQVGDEFGGAVAVDGDTLVVGARFEASSATGVGGDESDNSETESGAVYVFTRSAGVWSQQAYVKASNTSSFDQFGVPLALDGDTLVVGAVTESSSATGVNGDESDNSALESGAVYVLR